MMDNKIAHWTRLQRYYKYHSFIYDATRWSFLFGRRRLLLNLPELISQPRILEIGCGTGKNLQLLEYLYPHASITGVDLSEKMLEKAAQKTGNSKEPNLMQYRYGSGDPGWDSFDLIVLSYSLTMIGENIDNVLQLIHEDLNPNGYIAVVDFHDTPFTWFQRWMSHNHVSMDGTILPMLKNYFMEEESSLSNAYLGMWKYFIFLGKRS